MPAYAGMTIERMRHVEGVTSFLQTSRMLMSLCGFLKKTPAEISPRVIVGNIRVCPALLNRILQSAVERVEQMELLDVAFVFEMNRIVAGETSVAEATLVAFEVSVHSLIGKIGEGIGFDKAADLFN